jgi:urease accessory protein
MTVKNEIEVNFSGGISRTTKMRASYPYKFCRSNIAAEIFETVFLLGFGGGVVAGDHLELKVTLHQKAILFLRTQGSTKIFKSIEGKHCTQIVSVKLFNDSLFAFLPDPTTCFKESRYKQHQIYHLQENARLKLIYY